MIMRERGTILTVTILPSVLSMGLACSALASEGNGSVGQANLINTATATSITVAQAAAPAQPGIGQGAAADSTAQGGGVQPLLKEVIVTAEKRSTVEEKTPVAISVVSQQTLTQAGVDDYQSIQKVMPDVNITQSSAGPTIGIRGLYSDQGNAPGQQGIVALYFDGGYLNEEVINGMMFDLADVEVDKGPQSTLFGKDAEAGAINFISNQPQLGQMSGEGQLEFGSYNTVRTEGVVNLPVSDTFALRIAGMTYSHNGYMASGLDDADLHSARISALWRPNDAERLSIVYDYEKDDSNDDLATVSNVIGVEPGITGIYVPSNPRNDTFYDGNTNSAGPDPFRENSLDQGLTIQNDLDIGVATWTTIFAYRNTNLDWVYPTDEATGPDALVSNGASCTAPAAGCYPSGARSYVPQHTQEEMLDNHMASNADTPWQWVLGLYLYQNVATGTMQAFGSDTATSQSLQIAQPYDGSKSGAVYGQATFTPSGSKLHLTLGGRVERDYADEKDTFTDFGPFTVSELPYASHSWDSAVYRAEVSYDLTPNSLLYADTATSFMAGGYGYGPGTGTAGPIEEPEHITAYEIGSKNLFLHHRLQVNLEAWIYRYSNELNPEVFFDCAPGSGGAPICGTAPYTTPLPTITVANSGQALYHGASLDTDWLITPADEFKLDVSWQYAKYGTYIESVPTGYSLEPGTPVTSSNALSNTPVANIPEWVGIASYQHTWTIPTGHLSARVNAQSQTRAFESTTLDPIYGNVVINLPGFAMYDFQLMYQPSGGKWNITLYDHNLTNRLVYDTEGYSATTHAFTASFYPPRIFGVIIAAKF
jgi:iron complex outermembrane recepter protein